MRSSAKAGLPESFLHDVPEVGSPEAVRLDTEGKPKGYGPLDLKALVASGGKVFRAHASQCISRGRVRCARCEHMSP